MLQYRRLEESVGGAVSSGEIHGEMHLGIGQEAVAVVLGPHLRPEDALVSTHRPHLHALAAGVDPIDMLAEILERDGLNHGKGGHMHLFDPIHNFMCTGIVGASGPIALGYALAQSLREGGALTVAVLGDGSMNQGAVAESMNLAAARSLPVLFLCEDNGYSISVPKATSTSGELAERAGAYGIGGSVCDGTDAEELDALLSVVVAEIRETSRPALVVAELYRFRGHYEGDLDLYRSAAEKDAARDRRDPVTRLRERALQAGVGEEQLADAEAEAALEVAGWFAAARERAFPSTESAFREVFTVGAPA
jgi:pyruvate dehydrogenase E1 component alpha subunit